MAGIKLTELPLVLYQILDTVTGEFWKTSQNKLIWTRKAHAKSAWTGQHWREDKRFNDQERYKIVRFSVPEWINDGFI